MPKETILITPAAWDLYLAADGSKQPPAGLEHYFNPDQTTRLYLTTELRENFEMECNRKLTADVLELGEWDQLIAWCKGDAGEENANAPLFDVTEYQRRVAAEPLLQHQGSRLDVGLNAALIMSQMDFVGRHPLNVVDAIAKAAVILGDIEEESPVDNMWDHEGHCDWETVCARIAEYIRCNKDAPDKQTITEFIKDNA